MGRRRLCRRSRAARKAWDTRTRRQGIYQIGKAIIGRNTTISTIRFAKNLTCGTAKVVNPRGFRQSTLAKRIDRL